MNVAQWSLRIAGWFVLAGSSWAQTTRSSVDSSGVAGNDGSGNAQISADGRVVVFGSFATNLVAGDTNFRVDVFVHDRISGVTERVSVDSSDAEANDDSGWSSISADGRFVAFQSWASNLVAGDTNNLSDVFVHDRSTGITECVSVDLGGLPGDSMSFFNSIAADGRFVAFESRCSNLVSGDTNGAPDVFVRDRLTGVTERVSVDSSGGQAKGSSAWPSISPDGRIVVFQSDAATLVSGDGNGHVDIFVHDRSTGITERVTTDSSGIEADDDSYFPSVSADGEVVAFMSDATNLDPNDANSFSDVFVHDRRTGRTECVSLNQSGSAGDEESFKPISLSADGRFVSFTSDADDLVWNDTNGNYDVFVRDRVQGLTSRASVDSSGFEAHGGGSVGGSMTPDGELVAFFSDAWSLVDNDDNHDADVFVHDRCDAYWLDYDVGFPGTLGIPAFTAESDPVLGSALTLDLGNSLGVTTTGLLFIGFQRASLPTAWGGDLLVLPAFAIWMVVPASGASFDGTLPNNPSLCNLTIDLQTFEADPGAASGISFTRGFELILER